MLELGTVGLEVRVRVWMKDGIIGHSILGSGEWAGYRGGEGRTEGKGI
jgi:hypothetical protein